MDLLMSYYIIDELILFYKNKKNLHEKEIKESGIYVSEENRMEDRDKGTENDEKKQEHDPIFGDLVYSFITNCAKKSLGSGNIKEEYRECAENCIGFTDKLYIHSFLNILITFFF
jgi:hypothetical protein